MVALLRILFGDTALNVMAGAMCTCSQKLGKASAHPRKPSTKTSGSLLSPAKAQLNPLNLLLELRKQHHTCGLMPLFTALLVYFNRDVKGAQLLGYSVPLYKSTCTCQYVSACRELGDLRCTATQLNAKSNTEAYLQGLTT